MLIYQKENKNSSQNGKNKNVELEVEVAPLVYMEPLVVLVTPAHTLLAASSLSPELRQLVCAEEYRGIEPELWTPRYQFSSRRRLGR